MKGKKNCPFCHGEGRYLMYGDLHRSSVCHHDPDKPKKKVQTESDIMKGKKNCPLCEGEGSFLLFPVDPNKRPVVTCNYDPDAKKKPKRESEFLRLLLDD
jgi:DnaJ-class molecular chaperone